MMQKQDKKAIDSQHLILTSTKEKNLLSSQVLGFLKINLQSNNFKNFIQRKRLSKLTLKRFYSVEETSTFRMTFLRWDGSVIGMILPSLPSLRSSYLYSTSLVVFSGST